MDFIWKDWNAARLVESVYEPTLTGISSNEARRKLYWRIMEDYATMLCGYFLFKEEK
jgi:hypothetical protein